MLDTFSCQDQLNFHKLLGCDCQIPERKYSRVERCISSLEAVQVKDETYGHSTEGSFLSLLVVFLLVS